MLTAETKWFGTAHNSCADGTVNSHIDHIREFRYCKFKLITVIRLSE